jgi:hypothetical protein
MTLIIIAREIGGNVPPIPKVGELKGGKLTYDLTSSNI